MVYTANHFIVRLCQKLIMRLLFQMSLKITLNKNYKLKDDQITLIPRGCDTSVFNKNSVNDNWLNTFINKYPNTKIKKY